MEFKTSFLEISDGAEKLPVITLSSNEIYEITHGGALLLTIDGKAVAEIDSTENW